MIGGNPLLAGRQLLELRLGRQRHLQDPPGQGHFKDFHRINYQFIYLFIYLLIIHNGTFKILRGKVTSIKYFDQHDTLSLFPNNCFPFSISALS